MKITNKILDPRCIFCGYDGPRYWMKGSHDKACPFFIIESRKKRQADFPNQVKKLWIIFKGNREGGII